MFRLLRNLVLLVALVAAGAALWPRLAEMHKVVESDSGGADRLIDLRGVVVDSFDDEGRLETRVTGDGAHVDKTMRDLEIEPARVEVYEAGARRSTITAKTARKIAKPGESERIEFEGDVRGHAQEGHKIFGEKIHYLAAVKDIVSPAPATVLTTDTRIRGETLRGNVDLQRGIFRGKVQLEHIPPKVAKPGAPARAPLKITGDEAEFDLKAKHHRIDGTVRANQGGMTLRSATLDFHQDQESLLAAGDVTVRDGPLVLTGQFIEYRLDRRRALARGAPKVIQTAPDGTRQELVAREILASTPGQWIRGKDNVRLVTYLKRRGRMVKDAEIQGDEVEAFYESGRATFKGRVLILSDKASASGKHAVYYRDSRRVYVNGDAVATEKDATGRVARRVRGEHILYNIDTGKSVVLGGVTGSVSEGG